MGRGVWFLLGGLFLVLLAVGLAASGGNIGPPRSFLVVVAFLAGVGLLVASAVSWGRRRRGRLRAQ